MFVKKDMVAQLSSGAHRLRALREGLGYTMREVEAASIRIAQRLENEEFVIPPSRLSDIETKGVIPSIFRLYSLAAIYRFDYRQLLSSYGINLNGIHADFSAVRPRRSHLSQVFNNVTEIGIPLRMDAGFVLQKTTDLGRMIEQWGVVPLASLSAFANDQYSYGHIGEEDFTMYPILPPGSFVQVDLALNKVVEDTWRSEFERPIYFVETRDGFTCCWCHIKRDCIVLQPHPLSPVPARILKHPQEAEVVGQVVGVAIRLGDRRIAGSLQAQRERAAAI
jgi:transcriptional regulator with XRE-family HTH domain